MRRYEEVDRGRGHDLCEFCYPGADRSVLYEDDDFYVMPSLGQFVEGYVLLLSKAHRDCVADVADHEFVALKSRIATVLEDVYGSYCFFEHGQVGSCYQRAQSKICYHAHLHCLPVPENFLPAIERDFEYQEVESILELADLREKSPHYLYVETADGEKRFFEVEDDVERQYLRKQACEARGIPRELANWKQYPFRAAMDRTADRLDGLFEDPLAVPYQA